MGRAIVSDLAESTLAAAYTEGVSTSFRVQSGDGAQFGSPSTDHPVRFAVIAAGARNAAGKITDETKYAVYLATTRSDDTLSGLTFESGTAQNFEVGDILLTAVFAQHAIDVETGLAAAEAAITSHASSLSGKLAAASNLSDLDDAEAARTNLGLSGFATADTGSGTVLAPTPGGTPVLMASRAGRTECTPRIIIDYEASWPAAPGDADWVTVNLRDYGVTPGATRAYFNAQAFGPADARLYYRAPNVFGSTSASVPGFDTKHSKTLVTTVANVRHGWEASVPLSADGKFEYQRSNPGGTVNFGLYLTGWEGGPGVNLSAPQVVVAGNSNQYVGFPDAWVMPVTGTRLVAYYDWDEVTPNTHSTGGGAIWLRRNEAAGAKLFTGASVGGGTIIPNEGFPCHNPSSPAQAVMLLFRVDNGAAASTWYSTSANDGATWAAPAALPAISSAGVVGSPTSTTAPSGTIQPFFVQLNADGTKLYANWFGQATGHAGESSCLLESSNGVNWTVRSWINYGDVFSGNECCTVRVEGGRLVSVIRSATLANAAATCYSDDDGLTWSAPVAQTSPAQGHRPGIPLSGGTFALLSRWVPAGASGTHGVCYILYKRDGTEIGRSAPLSMGNASNVAYFTVIREPDGNHYVYYYSDCNRVDNGNPSLMKSVLEIRP